MRRAVHSAVLLACSALWCPGIAGGQTRVYGYDLRGRAVTRLADPGDRATVLLFLATDCPVSNRYLPEIERLAHEFAQKNATFWLVFPNAGETAAGTAKHAIEYGLTGRTLIHPTPALMALAPATITPEAAVLGPMSRPGKGAELAYLGRIDDRYLGIGRERPQANHHDLEQAILAVLRRGPVALPGGPPVGCGIVSESRAGNR